MRPDLPPDYRPCDDEEFMNPLQTEYFRQKLLAWRAELLADSSGTLRHLKEESLLKPDLTDRATLETLADLVRSYQAQKGQWPPDRAAVLALLMSAPKFQCAGNDFEYDPATGALRLLVTDADRC